METQTTAEQTANAACQTDHLDLEVSKTSTSASPTLVDEGNIDDDN